MEYHKINTLFKRDQETNKIIEDQWVSEEAIFLKHCTFECTEKIDGTNMRIELHFYPEDSNMKYNVEIKGRTDKANIPQDLITRMCDIVYKTSWTDVFPTIDKEVHVTIYGEGYGKKIQAVGSRYLHDNVDFILFDVKVGEYWLDRQNCADIASKIGVKIVPVIGYLSIPEAINYVKRGFTSWIAEDTNLPAEGLVLRPCTTLFNKKGERIIFKIKTRDFR